MTTYESELTKGNFTLRGKWPHIYITPFLKNLPPDVFGGTGQYDRAPKLVRLDFGALWTDTFVPTQKSGKPRYFFQDRSFVREFFSRTDAKPGETVLFEQLTPYHFKLSLRKLDGRVVSS
ncbi:hypothetical protein [Mesorhizobium sp.]|uniref:hypothetical protein n=1 Tax=Mesorhizobium sp. TaxID=1871066 RepID=UPI000FE2BE7D|nr:hypothetical protein [Mesorhizobium sp.]RWQ14148.1 MAG: hypothetical protein EOR92_27355 [Mesorhizobium sp.]